MGLRTVLAELDTQRAALAEAGDYEALAMGAQDLDTLLGDMRNILRSARLDLAEIIDDQADRHVGTNRVEIDGVGAVETRGGWTRKNWDSKRLLRTLLAKAIAEVPGERIVNEDGEVLDVAESATLAAITQVLEDCLPITGSLSWRSGEWPDHQTGSEGRGLKKHGVDDEAWCDRVEKPRMAIIPKRR